MIRQKNISCLSNSSAAQCKVIHIKFHVGGHKKNRRCNEEKVLGENYLRVGKLEKSRSQRENDQSLWGLIPWFSWPLLMLCWNKFHFHWHTSTIDIKVNRVNSTHKLYFKNLCPHLCDSLKFLFSECGSKQRFYFWAKVVAAKYPANKWEA